MIDFGRIRLLAYRARVPEATAQSFLYPGFGAPIDVATRVQLERAAFELQGHAGTAFQRALSELEAFAENPDGDPAEREAARRAIKRLQGPPETRTVKAKAAKPAGPPDTRAKATARPGPPDTRTRAAHSAPSLAALAATLTPAEQQLLIAELPRFEARVAARIERTTQLAAPRAEKAITMSTPLQMQLNRALFGTESERAQARAQLEATPDGAQALAYTTKMLGSPAGKRGIWLEPGYGIRVSARPALKNEGR
ncbi:MAG: hypothetical protein QM756_24065 [Polyangiaceae bacterium]